MYGNSTIEWMIAREKRRDLLRQAEQDRLVRLAEKGRKSRCRASRQARSRLSIRMMRRKAVTQVLYRETPNAGKAGCL